MRKYVFMHDSLLGLEMGWGGGDKLGSRQNITS